MLKAPRSLDKSHREFVEQLVGLLEQARRNSARSVNALMSAAHWEIGRRIVEQEQRGQKRAQYGKALLQRLATDLSKRFGKGFSERNLLAMREFYRAWPIPQTLSAELRVPGTSRDLQGISSSVVPLRPTPLGQQPASPLFLRERSPARRLVRPATRPANRHPILRAHPVVAK